MKIFFKGGPLNGQTTEFTPGMVDYLHPIPLPIMSVQDSLQAAMNPGDPTPNYAIARYKNTFRASVDALGRVGCVIFQYDRTERA